MRAESLAFDMEVLKREHDYEIENLIGAVKGQRLEMLEWRRRIRGGTADR